MPGEEQQRWRAEVQLGRMPLCCLPGRAGAGEGEDAGRVRLWNRMLHRGGAPVDRSPRLSASDGSAFAEAPGAPPGSGRCSAGP